MKPEIIIGVKNKHDKANDPDFYDVAHLDWVTRLENNYDLIFRELQPLLSSNLIPPNFEEKLYFPARSWKVFYFSFYKIWIKKNCALYPETTRALNEIPRLIGASISLMEAGTEIKPHIGNVERNYALPPWP